VKQVLLNNFIIVFPRLVFLYFLLETHSIAYLFEVLGGLTYKRKSIYLRLDWIAKLLLKYLRSSLIELIYHESIPQAFFINESVCFNGILSFWYNYQAQWLFLDGDSVADQVEKPV
jgi:hypothetical protein